MNTTPRGNLLAMTAAVAAVAMMGSMGVSSRAQADEHGERNGDEVRIRRGFEIAPVPLNLKHRNRDLVGLGSYLVNAVGDCNGCHSAGPQTEYAPGGNPYLKNQPQVVNQATYLGGGRDFGPLVPGTPNIVSRNLTPDKTGRPEGGRSFEEFRYIIRTGADLDHVHPNCSDTVKTNCFPNTPPASFFNADLLQIMPWPVYQNMTDHELRAIYEYLSAIPCVEGSPDPKSVLHNDCS